MSWQSVNRILFAFEAECRMKKLNRLEARERARTWWNLTLLRNGSNLGFVWKSKGALLEKDADNECLELQGDATENGQVRLTSKANLKRLRLNRKCVKLAEMKNKG